MILDDSTDNSVFSILRIIKEEGTILNATTAIEETEEKNISNTVRVSLKINDKVFRITLSWVRNECLEQGSILGTGYIQTDWKLRLRADSYPWRKPFLWHMERILTDQELAAGPPFPPKRILDETLVRSLIREKLGAPPLP